MESPVQVELLGKKKKSLSTLISILALAVSLISLVCTVQPNFIPWNTNYEQRALAGNLRVQMFLANHYFQTEDYEKSLYWYRIAKYRAKEIKDLRALAIIENNLGYIYAVGLGIETNAEVASSFFWQATAYAKEATISDALYKCMVKNYFFISSTRYMVVRMGAISMHLGRR